MTKLIPLGGLGEIGLNAMVFESRGEQLLVDCGLMFPNGELPGVEIVVPDFSHLLENRRRLKGIVLTHAHEDHVGALPYLLRELDVPVYGTKFTLALVRHRLNEMEIHAELREVSPREVFRVGEAFRVEPVRVCHSIPDGVGLAIRTGEGTIVHTGDFKLDGAPIDGRPTDLERLGELGDEGVLGLLSDSTNSEMDEESGMERTVAETFERVFREAKGRVIVTLFASNLNRLQHLMDLAARTQRRVVLNGRSLVRNVELAREAGYLRIPDGVLLAPEEVGSYLPQRVLILATGAQGEPRAGMTQMLAHNDRPVRVQPGDTVVFSARIIPGNERAVTALQDQLLARGAVVIHPGNTPGVHVTGHGGRQEQRRMLEAVRPRHFVPIHGELHHLHRHLQLAEQVGVASRILVRDGQVLGLSQGGAESLGQVPVGRVFRERFSGQVVDPATLSERQELAGFGLVAAIVVIDRSNNRLVSGPTLHGRGLVAHELAALPRITEEVRAQFLELSQALRGDEPLVKETLVHAVRRAFKAHGDRRPSVLPVVVKL